MGMTLLRGEIAFDCRRAVGNRFRPDMREFSSVQYGKYHLIAAVTGPMRRHQCD
jgi:hypothetical protein